MYIQIVNPTKLKHNTIRVQTTLSKVAYDTIQAIKRQGWVVTDCHSRQLRDDLVNQVYRGVDGKTVPAGTRQYKSRAKSMGTLNINRKKELLEI